MRNIFSGGIVLSLSIALTVAGCVTPANKAATVAQPKTPVAKTITNFEQAKRCMDQLFLDAGKRDIPITSGDIRDATRSFNVSVEDMVISALSGMTERSRAFRYFTIEENAPNINGVQNRIAPLSQMRVSDVPRIYIRGSISQSDTGVTSDSGSVAVTIPYASLGYDQDQVTGTASVDLQLASTVTRTIVPGATTSNTITIVNNDQAASARGLINNGAVGAALSVSLSSSEREGKGQAIRTLIEYSLIELLGKYTRVPYQRCLGLEASDPASMQAARDRYDDLTPAERTKAVQDALARLRLYGGPIDGVMTIALQDAVTAAKTDRGLVPNGRIDFQLFNALYQENAFSPALVNRPARNTAMQPPVAAGPVAPGGRDPLGLQVSLLRGDLRIGDPINLQIKTSTPAKVFCYYEFIENSARKTARIFPNRYHQNNTVTPGALMTVPSPSDPFQIRLNNSEEEAIACIATNADYRGERSIQDLLVQPDLEPLICDYEGLDCPIYVHQGVDTLRTTVKKITFRASR